LHRRGMKQGGESRKEATQWKLLTPKSAIKIGTWNVRTMYATGKSLTIAREMRAYKLQVLGISETRWLQSGQKELTTGELILYSGHAHNQANHTEGVGFMLSREAQKALLRWEPVSSRIIKAKFRSSQDRIALNIIQCYAPTNDAEDRVKEEYYQRLEETIRKCSKRDVTLVMGDMNAKVGSDNSGYEEVTGKHGLGTMNENGELFASCCATNNLVIGGTTFPHRQSHKATWVSPDMRTENQIDHICISRRFRRTLQDVRVRRGADVATDHHLVLAKLQLKLKKNTTQRTTGSRFEVAMLANPVKNTEYHLELANRYQALQNLEEAQTVEDKWRGMREAWTSACRKTVGKKSCKHQDWITPETLQKVDTRKRKKEALNSSKTRAAKQVATQEYRVADRDVKSSARRDKRAYIERMAEEAEEAAGKNNIRALYDNIKKLTNRHTQAARPVKSNEGETLKIIEEQLIRWKEHFSSVLNQPPPANKPIIPPAEEPLNIDCSRPSKAEIKKAVKQLKNNKAPGPDNIPAEALKADIGTSTDMLYELLGSV